MNISPLLKFRNQLSILLIVPIALLLYITQVRIEDHKGVDQKIEKFMFLPKGEYLKPAVLGYEQLVGDIVWLTTIQVLGDKEVSKKGYDWAYHALDVVTTLDPRFSYAYQLGGINLSVLGQRPDLGNMLLEKGMKENPDVWQIPFYIGFNNYFYLNDYISAAEYMKRASELKGSPAYLPQLAARLYVQAGNPAVALEFLARMYRETDDEKMRSTIEMRIKEIIVERDARLLEEAVTRYKDIYKVPPGSIDELVRANIIHEVPQEPFGGYYYFSTDDGKVYSSVIKERMRVYGKG